MDKNQLIQKSDLSVRQIADQAGLLLPEQARNFIQLALPETAVLNEAQIIPMERPQRRIEKFRFDTRVLVAGSEGEALSETERSTPRFSMQELSSRTYKAEINVPKEVLEDNIEKDRLLESLLMALAPRVGLDWEEVGLNGDTTNQVDPFLATIDGIVKQGDAIEYDHEGDVPNLDLWHRSIKLMPPEFQRVMSGMAFYTAYNIQHDWRANVAGRMGTLGDQAILGRSLLDPFGVRLVPVANIPDSDQYQGVSNYSKGFLTHPKNIAVGLHAGIEVDADVNIREGVWIVVLRFRSDWKLIEKTAFVRMVNIFSGATSVNVGGCSTAQLIADDPTPLSELGYTVIDTAIGAEDGVSIYEPPTDEELGVTAPGPFYSAP